MLSLLFWIMTLAHSEPSETIYEVIGYSPELSAVFAVNFESPDNRKCVSYIWDLEKKKRFVLPAQPDIAKAVVAMGEEDERSSCALRSFDVQLELKLKTLKTLAPEERKTLEPFLTATTNRVLAGFKDAPVNSLGAWLKAQRTAWAAPMAQKLYDLGALEAEDSNWLDSYDALVMATEIKPGTATAEGRDRARHAIEKASHENSPKAVLIWEVATLLDSKSAPAILGLAANADVSPERAIKLVQRALAVDPVLATRTYREEANFKGLRCDPKIQRWRARLPASLVQGVDCTNWSAPAHK